MNCLKSFRLHAKRTFNYPVTGTYVFWCMHETIHSSICITVICFHSSFWFFINVFRFIQGWEKYENNYKQIIGIPAEKDPRYRWPGLEYNMEIRLCEYGHKSNHWVFPEAFKRQPVPCIKRGHNNYGFQWLCIFCKNHKIVEKPQNFLNFGCVLYMFVCFVQVCFELSGVCVLLLTHTNTFSAGHQRRAVAASGER